MLRLLLLRHAKSDWSGPGLRDHDRPLAPRGFGTPPASATTSGNTASFPQPRSPPPPAGRGYRAARLEAAGAPPEALRLIPELYGSSPDEILRLVRRDGAAASPLLVVAHNPGMEDLVARLTGRPERFPTAALAVATVSVTRWAT